MTELDVDRPEERSEADVTLITRGITVTARVDVSQESTIVVCPAGEGTEWKTSVKAGDPVEIYWVGGQEERTLKARISSVEADDVDPRWHLSVTGPAQRSQRRKAVRGRVELAVVIPWGGASLTGTTVDVSEAGMRALVDGWGLPPDPGTGVDVSLTLEDVVLDLHGEVVWHADRGPQWLMAMKFVDVPEKAADLLRRRVFQALRDERARAAD